MQYLIIYKLHTVYFNTLFKNILHKTYGTYMTQKLYCFKMFEFSHNF